MIQSAINSAIHDSQIYTLNMLKQYLKNKIHENDRIFGLLDDFGEDIMNSLGTIKKKKEPSNFNLFIGTKIKEYKLMNPDYDGHTLMRMAIDDWKEQKEKNMLIV